MSKISIHNIILPNKSLSNFELLDAIKQLHITHFRGIFLRDQLFKKPWKNECGIINLADSDDSQGTHWCCYYKKDNTKYCFDSYGLQPPLEIIKYLNETDYNKIQIQSGNQVICGHLCLFVLYNLCNNISFDDVIYKLLP